MKVTTKLEHGATVFDFTCFWKSEWRENSFTAKPVHRYVVAKTEQEAIYKMEQYIKELIDEGFDELWYLENPTVDNYRVIV